MKTYIPYSLLAAIASCGLAVGAETAYTTPVGYETLNLTAGTNYTGLRLQQPVVIAGKVSTITANSFSDSNANFGTVLTGGETSFYIVEFLNSSGAIQEVTGASASGSTLNITDDVTSMVAAGDRYQVRRASTLSSVFGASNSAGLAAGFFGPAGADIVATPDGSGGLDQYYYDEDQGSWAKVNSGGGGDAVSGDSIPLVYVDGVVMTMGSPLDVVVSGEVKKEPVAALVSSGTNYLGSVYPAGATLATSFGSAGTIATLDPGFFGPAGADIFQLPDGAGGFNQYYYDEDQGSWAQVNSGGGGDAIDATSVEMTPGFALVNVGGAFDLLNSPPSFYSSL